jgi:cold shock CspA family protein
MEDKKALSDEDLEGVSGGITGKVVWYNARKGYGSLADGSGKETMVFFRDNPGVSLEDGQRV